MDKIKPCPFCGHKPKIVDWNNGGYQIRCGLCGARQDVLYDSVRNMKGAFAPRDGKKEAIEAWNRRANE